MSIEDQIIASLYEWQSPDEMGAAVDRLAGLLGDDVMQRRGRAFREGFLAARFARTAKQDAVRLLQEANDEVTPDFEVRTGDIAKKYETTEADVPGWKRQLEYRNPRPAGIEQMIFTPLDEMVGHMKLLTAKKAEKAYRDCTGLVVYLNPPAFSFDPMFRESQMKEATEPAARAFDEVWLLRDRGTLLWKHGEFIGNLDDDF